MFLGPANIQKADFTVSVPLIAPNGHKIITNDKYCKAGKCDLSKFAPKLKHDTSRARSCELSNENEINDKIRSLTSNGMDDEITKEMKQNKFTCTGQNSICAVYTCSAQNFQVFDIFLLYFCTVTFSEK